MKQAFLFLALFLCLGTSSAAIANKCVKVGTKTTTISTRDHHCSKHCKGEPTRTNYRVRLPSVAHPTFSYRNARLQCVSGPCGGWNKVIFVKIEPQPKGKQLYWTAKASFDVWSKPTTWKLTADLLFCK